MTRERPIRVVVADDADDLRYLLRLELEAHSEFSVVGDAATGREAIDVAAASQPDVVLLDLAMPDMDGLEALPLILGASPETAVVVLSGYHADLVAEEALLLGAAAFVDKTAVLTDLRRVLLSVVDRASG